MAASSRGSRGFISFIRSSRHSRVCSDCISSLSRSRRCYATMEEAVKVTFEAPAVSNIPLATSKGFATDSYIVKSGILLSRPPLITRALTPFENAFFFYQKRLNERLAMPFTRYFYFKKDTPADHDWKRKARERNGTAARELGGYQAYGELGWNDEVLVGDKLSEPRTMVEALVKDAVMKVDGEETGGEKEAETVEENIERPLERWTEADKLKDRKRLDRKLARTLYLCVKSEQGGWVLPNGILLGRENLHQAAERILVQSVGLNMNTWIVGHVPVGYYKTPSKTVGSPEIPIEKTFFMKGRIMAGQADLQGNRFGLKDFMWLTKQEMEKQLDRKFFEVIKNMMSDR